MQCKNALTRARGAPAFCVPSVATLLFVVGLPKGHGWRRADWALIEVMQPGFSKATPAAMVSVVNAYPDAVEVHILYQTISNVSLDGAAARLVGTDERVRLGKFVGRIAKVGLTGVELDIGAEDRVTAGDVYQVLSRRDHLPVGRVRITDALRDNKTLQFQVRGGLFGVSIRPFPPRPQPEAVPPLPAPSFPVASNAKAASPAPATSAPPSSSAAQPTRPQ